MEKMCKDCDYYRKEMWPRQGVACVARAGIQRHRVTGRLEYVGHDENLAYIRSWDDDGLRCGPDAAFFKTKPSLWKRLKRALLEDTPVVRW